MNVLCFWFNLSWCFFHFLYHLKGSLNTKTHSTTILFKLVKEALRLRCAEKFIGFRSHLQRRNKWFIREEGLELTNGREPTVFLREWDLIPPNIDPDSDTVGWILASHPFETTVSDIDQDLAQNNVYRKQGVPFRIRAEHEANTI